MLSIIFLTSSRQRGTFFYVLCNTNFSFGHSGENDVKRHTELKKHVDFAKTSALSNDKFSFF